MACIPDNTPKSVILSTETRCPECRYEIQAMLRRVQGVYSVAINADRNTVTVSGNLAPKELLETLLKVSQDCDFCMKPPAHVMPSSCPVNRPTCTTCHLQAPACSRQCARPLNGIRVCSDAPMPVCCACTKKTTPPCHRSCGGYQCYGSKYPCHGRY